MRRLSCSRKVERAMGIEPTSSAWEAEVMAIIRRPQNWRFYRGWVGMASGWFGAVVAKLAWLDAGAVASPAVSGERLAIHAIHNQAERTFLRRAVASGRISTAQRMSRIRLFKRFVLERRVR